MLLVAVSLGFQAPHTAQKFRGGSPVLNVLRELYLTQLARRCDVSLRHIRSCSLLKRRGI